MGWAYLLRRRRSLRNRDEALAKSDPKQVVSPDPDKDDLLHMGDQKLFQLAFLQAGSVARGLTMPAAHQRQTVHGKAGFIGSLPDTLII